MEQSGAVYAHAYIFMIDTFHEHQLSVRPLGVGLVLKRPTQLLNGDVSFQDLVESGAGKQADAVRWGVGESGLTGERRSQQIDESEFTDVLNFNGSSCYMSER